VQIVELNSADRTTKDAKRLISFRGCTKILGVSFLIKKDTQEAAIRTRKNFP